MNDLIKVFPSTGLPQMSMMRAIQVSTPGGISALKSVQIPKPQINGNQILVKNSYSGINFIDTYHRSGLYKVELPFIPGREGSGVIAEMGSQVNGFAVGDRVCYTGSGSYAEYTIVNPGIIDSLDTCVKLPDEVGFEMGASLLLQGLTAMVLTRLVHVVKKNQVVLIHACAGGTGLLLTQLCKHVGATVIGTTSTSAKKAIAIEAGMSRYYLKFEHLNTV